jgi:hypothetical protein
VHRARVEHAIDSVRRVAGEAVEQRDNPELAAIPTVVVSAAGSDAISAVKADAWLPKPNNRGAPNNGCVR